MMICYQRLSTTAYKQPEQDNMENMLMHLTNYSLNKHSDNFEGSDDVGAFNGIIYTPRRLNSARVCVAGVVTVAHVQWYDPNPTAL